MENDFVPPRPLKTAVLMLIFNRPELSRLVFDAVRQAKPPRIYVASDGPRKQRLGEVEKVEEARQHVLQNIDWECEVRTLFRPENLGVKEAVSGAIDWFFESEECGAILEDDCLPSQSFFWFSEELLDLYRGDDRVMQISGGSYFGGVDLRESYYFSKYPHIWGWATWRDSWVKYRPESSNFEAEFRDMANIFGSDEEREYWRETYSDYFDGRYASWAYAWTFSVWKNRGLSVYPQKNLVKNIGFGSDALHTKSWKDYRGLRRMPLESITEIEHPDEIELNLNLDLLDFRAFFWRPPVMVQGFKSLQQIALAGVEGFRNKIQARRN